MISRPRRYSTFNVAKDQRALIRGAVKKVSEVSGRAYPFAQFTRDAFTAHLRSIWNDYNEGRPIAPIYDDDDDDDDVVDDVDNEDAELAASPSDAAPDDEHHSSKDGSHRKLI